MAIGIGNVPDDWYPVFKLHAPDGAEKTESRVPIGVRFVLSPVNGHLIAENQLSRKVFLLFL